LQVMLRKDLMGGYIILEYGAEYLRPQRLWH